MKEDVEKFIEGKIWKMKQRQKETNHKSVKNLTSSRFSIATKLVNCVTIEYSLLRSMT